MDPVTSATTFATIVSLVGDFISRREANESKDYESFMSWLHEQRHEEIRSLLQSSSTTVVGIKALLNESRDEILDRLSALDQTMAAIAAAIPAFSGIAELSNPSVGLSQQALSVLEQFHDSGASGVLESKIMNGIVLVPLDGNGGQIEFSERRFIEDDLTTLVELGLLDLSHNGRGQRIFKFKRTAAALVAQRRGA